MNEWIVYALGTLALTTPTSSEPADLSTVEDARPAPISAQQALEDTTEQVLPLATDGSGEVLRELGREDAARAGSTELRPGSLGVVDPESGDVQQIRDASNANPGTQTVFGALNQDHAIWTEQSSTRVSESDWTMYGFDRDTGQRSVVAKAEPIDDAGTVPTVPGFTIPTLDQDTVYWAQADPNPDDPRNPSVNVYAGRADGTGQPEKTVADAIMPVATESWLYYVEFDGSDPTADGYTVHRKSLRTGEDEVVTEESTGTVTELAAEGDTVAISVGGESVQVFSDGERVTTVRAGEVDGERETLGRLSIADGVLGFSDNSKQTGNNYALRIGSERLYELGSAPGLAQVMVTGSESGPPGVTWALGSETQDWRYGRLGTDTPGTASGEPSAEQD